MGVIVFILSLLLFFRGGGMVMYSFVISLMIWRIEKEYPKKIYGKVVDIKEDVDRKGRTLMRPTVEYLWKGKVKTCCKYINPNIDVKGPVPEADIVFSPDNIHVGDKVTIWYNPDNETSMFVQRRMKVTRLLMSSLVPGSFFILSGILGMCYLFSN